MLSKKTKRYKQKSPEKTISNIRAILDNLNIFLKESSFYNDKMNSCRLNIVNNDLDLLDIGTNGKGMSYTYALASGYAEFMERLQNDMLGIHDVFRFLVRKKQSEQSQMSEIEKYFLAENIYPSYIHSPDEKEVSIDNVVELYDGEIRQMFSLSSSIDTKVFLKNILGETPIVMLPFYSTKQAKEVLFPIDLALIADGSNGMCAGNTAEEAISQGLCEIFERYAISKIYFEKITPPTISEESFKHTEVISRMNFLKQKRGYEFIIKDCSLGIGLPVIGLITIDRKQNTYNFKLGADFVPEVALERCLTELHQSKNGSITVPFLKVNNTSAPEYMQNEYMKIVKNGTGQWPEELFSKIPSYVFKGFNDNFCNSDLENIHYVVKLVQKLGTSIYIRDNSFLGFPTYNIIIPGISNLSIKEMLGKSHSKYPLKLEHLFCSETYKVDDFIRDISPWIEETLKDNSFESFNKIFPFYCSKELDDLDPNLFLCMAYYKQENYQKSYEQICLFLQNKDSDHAYYYACSDYIRLKCLELRDIKEVQMFLVGKYNNDIADQVISDLSTPELIFQYYNFDKHIDCNRLVNNTDSRLINVLRLRKVIEQKKEQNRLAQIDLRNFFKQ